MAWTLVQSSFGAASEPKFRTEPGWVNFDAGAIQSRLNDARSRTSNKATTTLEHTQSNIASAGLATGHVSIQG